MCVNVHETKSVNYKTQPAEYHYKTMLKPNARKSPPGSWILVYTTTATTTAYRKIHD